MKNSISEREYKYKWDVMYMKCTICWERKIQGEFPKDKNKKFWTRSDCKECHRIKNREHHQKWYEKNKERSNESCREYHIKNRQKRLMESEMNIKRHTKELWFSWTLFHSRARYYTKKHNLKPKNCKICWRHERIEIHHPSYKSMKDWSKVVFCCHYCHIWIHEWRIECPTPVDLMECGSPLKEYRVSLCWEA